MKRSAELERITKETQIHAKLNLDGSGQYEISTGIGFFDHMLTLFTVHGLFDLTIAAEGDIEIDFHHTVEDVGLILGDVFSKALGNRKRICRYGHAVIPMDDTLADVAVDLSNRPFLSYRLPDMVPPQSDFDASLVREFFRSLVNRGGLNLHIRIPYGENWHHMAEAMFKGVSRAMRQAITLDHRVKNVPSSKGIL